MDKQQKTRRDQALSLVARFQTMLDAVAIFGLSGSLGWLAALALAAVRPLRGA